MASLSTYTTDVLTALNDPLQQFYTTSNLTTWINRARTDTAKATCCIRLLTPSSTSVTALTPVNLGSGYTSATVTISGPDALGQGFVQATATATVASGQVTGYTMTNQGTGYVLNPTITITGNGTGATATPTLGSRLITTAAQEVYTFAALNTILQANFTGVGSVIGIQDVAISQGALRPVLNYMPWSRFQALLRAWNQGSSYPAVWSQYGRDENGSFYLFPVPQASLEMQADCYCTPAALSAQQTVDLIPDNLYMATIWRVLYYAYTSAQRKDDANDMKERWREACAEAAAYAFPGRTPSFYSEE